MTITKEITGANDIINLAWSGAVDTLNNLTYSEIETVLSNLEDIYPEGMTDTELNDFLWFERDFIAEMLGYSDYEELLNDRD